MKYIKGHLHEESWSERECIARKFPAGTAFDSGITLCFWSALDAQPCFMTTDESNLPENLNISADAGKQLSFSNFSDITAQIEEISKTRNIDEILKKTNGFIAID